ncbi:hypothetical protein ATE47_06060 [Chryseobacterium sp. IHB B 17019]|jgi:hypothetical protein|uniref:hypothetical protein n=1 Tax=Chryseobacterium sp. IHB B 17019 TaxID=1721091 RepID=UPI00071EE562|nr:hypothetical protein [Chryseobacterium sp. IHB B 17019]ALR30112.1 hypothetical protein ATE47_06060 [Chryseobacterium sp. IHB B 17019]
MEKNKPENNSSSPYPREIPDLLSSEIKELYGLEIPENPGKEKIIHTLHRSYFGVFRKEIHIKLFSGRVIDYNIVYTILGVYMNKNRNFSKELN